MKFLNIYKYLWYFYIISVTSYKSYLNIFNKLTSLYQSKVALTREAGTNDKLKYLLERRGVDCIEIPCISFEKGQDINFLNEVLYSQLFDIIAISSPQVLHVNLSILFKFKYSRINYFLVLDLVLLGSGSFY